MLRRTPLKRTQQPLKRTPLKRVSGTKKSREDDTERDKKDREIYQEIWREREHICYESGDKLGREPLKTFFHHLLPKALFPQYRWEKWNIVLVSPRVHNQLEFSPLPNTRIGKLYLEVLEKHHNFEKTKKDE